MVNYSGLNLVIGDKNPENPKIPPKGLLYDNPASKHKMHPYDKPPIKTFLEPTKLDSESNIFYIL